MTATFPRKHKTTTFVVSLTHWADEDGEELLDELLDQEDARRFTIREIPEGAVVSLSHDEWNLVCQAMAAAKRGWTADYDYADDLVDKIDEQI